MEVFYHIVLGVQNKKGQIKQKNRKLRECSRNNMVECMIENCGGEA